MKRRKALARLKARQASYEKDFGDSRIESKGRKRPGSMSGRQ